MSHELEQSSDASLPTTAFVALLVISDFLVRQYLADELRERGCEVIEAMSAEEAITLLQDNFTPNIVFADHELSGAMTGLDLIGWLRRNTQLKALLTAGSFHPKFREVIGSQEFVSKPFTADELCERLATALGTQLRQVKSLYHLIYVSKAAPETRDSSAQDILEISRQRNSQLGITGMLLFADNRFIQVLEGSMIAVEKVFASIANDARHTEVKVLTCGDIQTRKFGAWSMGFEKIDSALIAHLTDAFILDEPSIQKRISQINEDVRALFTSFLVKSPV